MLKMYYLVSRKENFEQICVGDVSSKNDFPIDKTNVYPLGVFLSKLISIFDSFDKSKDDETLINNNPKPTTDSSDKLKYNEILSRNHMESIFNNFFEESSSFYNEVIDDNTTRRIFSILLTEDYDLLGGERNRNSIGNILEKCIPFIKKCQQEKEYIYPNLIELFSKSFSPMFPHHYDYISKSFHDNFDADISHEDIRNALETNISEEIKIKSSRKNTRPLFSIEAKKKKINYKNERTLRTPLLVYEIRDVADLMLATIKSILEQKLYIKECCHCEKLFVASRWNMLYCPKPLNARSSCKQNAKYKKDLEIEYRHLHNTKRADYATKYGSDSDIYYAYMEAHSKKIEAFEEGKITKEELVEWIEKYNVEDEQ